MTVEEYVPLAPLTTFRVGGPARWLKRIRSEDQLLLGLEWAESRKLPVFLLSGGSNLLVSDAGFRGLVLKMEMHGIERHEGMLEAAAGEDWDSLVSLAASLGLAGMECLAGIPGSVGATPVQNVGAYGQEVAETITAVRVFDRGRQSFLELNRADCRFRYRASLFNVDEPGRYVVTRVRFQLRPGGEPALRYADLQRYFRGAKPTLLEVAEAVREIRRAKGMVLVEGDPDTQSAGSFFKNPIVAEQCLPAVAEAAQMETAAVPHWAAGEECVKLSAAWLVERAGFGKGYRMGAAGLSTKHALALTNRGGATCADLLALEQRIRESVEQRFGVRLEREPVLLGDDGG